MDPRLMAFIQALLSGDDAGAPAGPPGLQGQPQMPGQMLGQPQQGADPRTQALMNAMQGQAVA